MNKNALVNSQYQSVNQNKSRKRIIEVQDRDVVTSATSGDGTVLTAVCFSVCEQSRITIKMWVGFRKIWGTGRWWIKEELIKFWEACVSTVMAVHTTRVHGPCSRPVNTGHRVHGPCWSPVYHRC